LAWVPSRTTDCHAHIFDPARFPYAEARRYTPPPARVEDLRALHARLGVSRVVLVQPSVYGTDNACLLDALAQFGGQARGIAVIDDTFSRQQLDDLYAAGVRGVRINLEASKQVDVSLAVRRLQTTAETLVDSPLIIQLYAALPVIAACGPTIATLRQRVLIDHFGLAKAARGRDQEGFDALLDLMAHPQVWMKLSGPYQISDLGPAYSDIEPVARALLKTAPSRTVWGSDWPHTGGTPRPPTYRPTELEPFRQEDDVCNLDLVRQWAPDPAVWQSLLADNPARLFGWVPSA
jgi:predicted TIM-barrel fold metal-dependent hydrolase